LTLSFRSVPDVLDAVDKIFAKPDNYSGLSGNAEKLRTVHESRKLGVPGLVEIWEPVSAEARDVPKDWRLPLDVLDAQDPAIVVARRVAMVVAGLTAPGSSECVSDGHGAPRAITPGDIMVLVRTRGAFFEAVIRALKTRQVPVAGADRLELTQHIAVMDLIAAGRTSLLRGDDLSLACVLKSPLLEFDDNDLVELSCDGQSLGASLRDRAGIDPRCAKAVKRLEQWRQWARHLTPFEFYARLLGEDGGRRRLLARLGGEAGDAIDEFLKLALDHEQRGPPSLIDFLGQLEHTSILVKRDMESGRDVVRVMTIHAAKGLEAKIVFLPDTCTLPNGRHDPKIFPLNSAVGHPVVAWSVRQNDDPAAVADARRRDRSAAQAEYRRLLYVALTRAEERLYIAGFHAKPAIPQGCWYTIIAESLADDLREIEPPWPIGKVWRRQMVAPRSETAAIRRKQPQTLLKVPAWLDEPAPLEVGPTRLVHPSLTPDRSGRAATSPARVRALDKGRLMHGLLQHLPALASDRRPAAGERFLALNGRMLSDQERSEMVQRARTIIESAELAALFGVRSRAEVAIAGRLAAADGRTIQVVGQIDRLAELEGEVWIADFKSGPAKSVIPLTYITQLALYRAVVAPLYPQKTIRCAIIWTSGPASAEIDSARLDAALRSVTHA
jgi:ATP-dependent helicase/nuclease subunit A